MNSIESRRQTNRVVIFNAVFLFALAALPYLQTLGHDFVYFDDQIYVTENPFVQQGLSVSNIRWAFTTFTAGNWHPITWMSHMLDVDLWRTWAGGHHLTNLLLHAANTCLLFFALVRMTSSVWRSAIVGALFAVHPLHVESVAWVAERKDVLSTFFGLLALLAYQRFARRGSAGNYLLILALFILSLMAKPMLVTLPFLFLLLDLWPLRRWRLWPAESDAPAFESRPFRHLLLEKLPLFAIAAVFSGIALLSQRIATVSSADVPFGSRLANAVVGYAFYLGKLVKPVGLAFHYPLPVGWPALDVIVSALILLGITVAVIVYRRQYPWLLIGWLWFVGLLVPVIGLVQIGAQAFADRYSYLPSVGIFIMLVWSIPERFPVFYPRASIAVASGLILILTVMTGAQAATWKDSRTLFAHATKVMPGNPMAHWILGHTLESEGDLSGALEEYRISAAQPSVYAKTSAHEDMANILIRQGQYSEAVTELGKSIEMNPKSSTANNSMGAALILLNEREQAVPFLRRAVELDPKNISAAVNCGMVLVDLGRWDEAIAQLSPITRAEPKRLLARTKLAIALAGRGSLTEAIAELHQVLEIDPDFAAAREALGEIEAQPRK